MSAPKWPIEVGAETWVPEGWEPRVGMRVQAHGGGVQSCAMYLHLREIGNLPAMTLACDTRHEYEHTHAAWAIQRRLCMEDGVPFVMLHRPVSIIDKFRAERRLPLPHRKRPSCSTWAKRDAMREYLRECVKVNTRKKAQVVVLIGYSTDEMGRVRDSDRRWITNEYPLLDARMSREDCKALLSRAWPGEVPKKSGCVWCPQMGTKGLGGCAISHPATADEVVLMEEGAAKGSGTLFRGIRARNIVDAARAGRAIPKERDRPVAGEGQATIGEACSNIVGCWT